MLKSIAKLIVLIVIIFLKSSTAYSQQITLNDKGDTLICFNKERAKYLLKNYYNLKECKENDSINTILIGLNKSVIENNKNYIAQQIFIINKQDSLIKFEKQSIDNLVKVVEEQNKDIAKQRTKTFVVGVAGVSSFLFMTYMWFNQLIKN